MRCQVQAEDEKSGSIVCFVEAGGQQGAEAWAHVCKRSVHAHNLSAVVQGFWTDFTNAVDVFSLGEVLHGNTR
jgi:hypothetical protein